MNTSIDNLVPLVASSFKLKLFTKAQLQKLIKNHLTNSEIIHKGDGNTIDFKPVVKIFTPDANCTWLLSELAPNLLAFGLCDLGMGHPELGYVSLHEIQTLRGNYGLPVERDRWFVADKILSQYAKEARREGRITA